MATQIDARVKQKTGTEADFAGFVLLEGEEARIRLAPGGPVWNTKTGPGLFDDLPYDFNPGGVPIPVESDYTFTGQPAGLFFPQEDGTYNGDVSVDLSDGVNYLVWDGSTLTKQVYPINLAGYATKTDLNNMYRPKYYDFNKQLQSDGSILPANNYVAITDLLPINPQVDVQVSRGPNTGQSVLFYDENGDYISSVSIGSGATGTATPPSGSRYMKMHASTNNTTRWDDLAAFGVFQSGYTPAEADPITSTTSSTNLYDAANTYDNHFIGSTGAIDVGTQDRFDYVLGYLVIEDGQTQLSFRRRATVGILGGFYSANMIFISGSLTTGQGGVTNGTVTIPSGARYFFFNVSNDPTQRELDKKNYTLVYGASVPDFIPVRQVTFVGGRPLASSVEHPLFNKRGVLQGDSIMRYSGTPQDTNGGFGMRALRDMGSILVANYAIGGTTIAQRSSEPTTRDPLVIRYTDMNPDADFVIIAAGTNDWNYDWTPIGTASDSTPNTLYGALNILLEGLLEMYMGKPIVWSLPIKRNFQLTSTPDAVNGLGLTLQEYSDIIAERCQFWGVYTFDMGKACGINPFISSHVTSLIPDGTHPNAAGSQLMANALQGFLRTLAV